MAAPKGNKFWLARSSHGRKPIFATADDMWSTALEYFEYNDNNPQLSYKTFFYQGEVIEAQVKDIRPLSIIGFCLFADISREAFDDYSKREGFIEVANLIKDTCYKQKFDGAASGKYNANIIARDLGLTERTDHTSTDGSMTPKAAINLAKLSDADLEALESMADKLENE